MKLADGEGAPDALEGSTFKLVSRRGGVGYVVGIGWRLLTWARACLF